MNRITRCATLVLTVLSLSSFAQVCKEISLYSNGEAGKVESGATFPEAPEWSANWGVISRGETEALDPPYIRLSGQKDRAGDWTATLSLSKLPVAVQGGNVALKVHSTQKAKLGFWLESDAGRSVTKYFNLEANRTYALQVPVADLVGHAKATIKKVGLGLFGVPAYQYTTLFVDDISLSCATGNEETFGGKFWNLNVPKTSAAYSLEERAELANRTSAQFVLSESEHRQIVSLVNNADMSAQKSRDGWFRNMYFVERNRLKDSVIAHPKALFYEAETFATSMDNKTIPLLIGNVDYVYRICADSACKTTQLLNSRVLQAGIPVATVPTSQIKLLYNPYFISTNRKGIPQVEIYNGGKWDVLSPNSEMDVEFESAGVQKIKVRLSEGGLTVNQTLVVEVK